MFEQILQLKDRYQEMVSRTTREDMTTWSADFFAQYPFIVSLSWEPIDDGQGPWEVELEVTAGYAATHTELQFRSPYYDGVEELRYIHPLTMDIREHKIYLDFKAAVAEVQRLFTAEDILIHVFGNDTFVKMTKDEIITKELCCE